MVADNVSVAVDVQDRSSSGGNVLTNGVEKSLQKSLYSSSNHYVSQSHQRKGRCSSGSSSRSNRQSKS